MNFERISDHNCNRIKDKLNQKRIKLWLPPFWNESQDETEKELKKLAQSLSQELLVPADDCLQYLNLLQAKALSNIQERNIFLSTGQAALKVKVPNEHGGQTLTVSLELTNTGSALVEEISKATSVPVDRLKVIFKGKFLKDDETLQNQGIVHGLHMMAIVLKENSEAIIAKHESIVQQLSSTKADIQLLCKSHYFQIADQTGKPLKLPPTERKSLMLAMTLHEKGRSAMKKEDFDVALIMLLEAEKEFSQCNSSLLKSVDNYGVLGLDIVWCYLNLQSVTQLPDAEERLRQCERSFQQSYGLNLERLAALKGFTGNESVLFMRLHLLQAIIHYHQNRLDESEQLLKKAEEELKNLQVDDGQLCQLIELGYGTAEARLALRASKGDITTAVSIIENKRLERRKNEEIVAEEKKMRKKRKTLGKCLNGKWIDPRFHDALLSMGFSYEISKWALAQSNNDINLSINLINENPQMPVEHSECNRNCEVACDSLQQIVKTGIEPKVAKQALKKHSSAIEEAAEELTVNGGNLLESSSHSQDDDDNDDDDDDNDDDDDDDDDNDMNAVPSTSQLKKKRYEAYSRLREGLSTAEEDHLDLNLEPESTFLLKYKDLISNR